MVKRSCVHLQVERKRGICVQQGNQCASAICKGMDAMLGVRSNLEVCTACLFCQTSSPDLYHSEVHMMVWNCFHTEINASTMLVVICWGVYVVKSLLFILFYYFFF